MEKRKPITVSGVTYSSVADAARTLGLKERLVHGRIKALGWSVEQALELAPRPRAILVQGTVFESHRALEAAFGVCSSTLRKRLKKGLCAEAALGLPGFGYEPPGPRRVSVGGCEFPSVAAASRAYGVDSILVHQRLRLRWTIEQALGVEARPNGTRCLGRIYRVTHLATGRSYVGLTKSSLPKRWSEHVKLARSKKKVTVNSLHAAIREHGSEAFSMSLLAEAHTTDDLATLEQHHITTLGTRAPAGFNLRRGGGGAHHKKGRSVVVNGIRYESILGACAALGLSSTLVNGRLFRGVSIEEAFSPARNAGPKPITFRGTDYPSIAALAAAFGADRVEVARRLALGQSTEQALGLQAIPPKPPHIQVGEARYFSLREAAEAFGMSLETLQKRRKSGLTLEAALTKPVLLRGMRARSAG